MVVGVADDFELDFFPAFQRFFHQDLGRESKGAFSQFDKGFFIGADAASQSAQRVCRTYHHRITDAAGCVDGVFRVLYRMADRGFQWNFVQLLYEKVTVFGVHNRFYRGAQYLYAVFFQRAVLVQFRSAIQCGLSSECQQDAVGAFFLDDFRNEMRSDRQEIYLVGNAFRSLYRSDVRVNQYRADAFLAQCFQGLRT